jgi:DNA-binding MarR family transcriptional regulator
MMSENTLALKGEARNGFTKIPNFIFEANTTPSEFKILALLYHHLPNAYPSLETLADKAGLSRRQVIRIVQALEKKGLVWREIRPNATTIYYPRQKLLNKKGG